MKLFEFVPETTQDCCVTAWLHGNDWDREIVKRKRPAMIICPGGGYGRICDKEAEPVAERYFAVGYNTFILSYSVGEEARNFKPLCQLASTIAHIRKHEDEFSIYADKIAVSGFSAGGHLTCSIGTLFNEKPFLQVFGRNEDVCPNAIVMGYPVITADEYAHKGSIENVSGQVLENEEYKWFGLDNHVDIHTPPMFLWHTAEDMCVPVENSLKMAAALSAKKIPFELHILPNGPHGMSVCTEEVEGKSNYNGRWVDWSVEWLRHVLKWE